MGAVGPAAPGSSHSVGCPSNSSSPSRNVTQGCLLRVHICRVGRSHDVSSRLPARTRTTPPRGWLYTQHPQSGHMNRVLSRPLSGTRWIARGSPAVSRNAVSGSATPQREGAARDVLAVSTMAGVDEVRLQGDLVPDFPALAAAR